jgi:tetratricopeptide (TPR) repeat protein
MLNLLLALALAAASFVAVTLWLGPIAAVAPALGVLLLALFLLSRRTAAQVNAELQGVAPLLQARRIDEAQTKLTVIKERYGRWQFLLAGQIDAQLGVIDYLQLKFDEARPKLEAGKWRNAVALCCLGCIDWRQGRKDEAVKHFAAAAQASSQDVMVYQVWATLLARDGQRTEALAAVADGLKAIPDNAPLQDLQSRIANKKKIDTDRFGEAWYQFFPEEYAQKMVMRGTRGPSPLAARMPQPRFGARNAPRR